MSTLDIFVRPDLRQAYSDLYTPDALAILRALAPFEEDRRRLMQARLVRRDTRASGRTRLAFLDPTEDVPGLEMTVQSAREGRFVGRGIPPDLQRQWIQGTGPAAKPNAALESSLRNVAYALLSGADGWMFDGEDALGQVGTMSLDNQRNLKIAIDRDDLFLRVAERVSTEMNRWAAAFLGRPIVADWREQLEVTTPIFRPRGLHLDDRHVSLGQDGFSASIVDLVLYIVTNHRALRRANRSLVLYLPKIQTAEEAALWNAMLTTLEQALGLTSGSVRTYVLVEQVEACFQLMEIRAALRTRLVGFNTGRWDYINSVVDAQHREPRFVHPNIDVITMTYGYMSHYEDRVRRAANTPDDLGQHVLWQGGMEPNIPVGSDEGVRSAMARAVAGAERERAAGASGKWVAHWKMVHIVRPVWERVGESNQLGRQFPPLTYTLSDAENLLRLDGGKRTIAGARDLISVGLQYANACGEGLQAAALKPADAFDNDHVLYLMEDMATAEIRLGILWEWLHKRAELASSTGPDDGTSVTTTQELLGALIAEEYEKLQRASDRNVHDRSKTTTLPMARTAFEAYVFSDRKLPWFVDLVNATLDARTFAEAERRIGLVIEDFRRDGTRLTRNLTAESTRSLAAL